MTYEVQDVVAENIAVLRARAERYRRLAHELFDRRTSEEVANLASELDAEIARLETALDPDIIAIDPGAPLRADCR